MKTIIRPANPDDIPFIYSTWLKSIRYDSVVGRQCRNSVFFEEYRAVIDKILKNEKTRVEILSYENEPGVILSYVVYDGSAVHFCFTKEAHRRLGYAKRLIGSIPYAEQVYCKSHANPKSQGQNAEISAQVLAKTIPAQILQGDMQETYRHDSCKETVFVTHRTGTSEPIFKAHPELVYNPFILYSK